MRSNSMFRFVVMFFVLIAVQMSLVNAQCSHFSSLPDEDFWLVYCPALSSKCFLTALKFSGELFRVAQRAR